MCKASMSLAERIVTPTPCFYTPGSAELIHKENEEKDLVLSDG